MIQRALTEFGSSAPPYPYNRGIPAQPDFYSRWLVTEDGVTTPPPVPTPEQDGRARQIGSAMRLGAVFSGRSGPILRRASLARTEDLLQLRVSKADEAMVSDTVVRRLSQTASQLRLKPDVKIG